MAYQFCLSKDLFVKILGDKGALILATESDEIIEFSGDVARMIRILAQPSIDEHWFTPEEVCQQLASQSETFSANPHQMECIEEVLAILQKKKFLKKKTTPK